MELCEECQLYSCITMGWNPLTLPWHGHGERLVVCIIVKGKKGGGGRRKKVR